MQFLKRKIPPPIVALISALIMFYNPLSFEIELKTQWKIAFIVLVISMGVIVDLWALLLFFKAKTSVNPISSSKTSVFVARGIYKYSRNPMYLGLLYYLMAWGAYLENALNAICLVLFIVYITIFQILPEQEFLKTKFGSEYEAYLKRVKMWL